MSKSSNGPSMVQTMDMKDRIELGSLPFNIEEFDTLMADSPSKWKIQIVAVQFY